MENNQTNRDLKLINKDRNEYQTNIVNFISIVNRTFLPDVFKSFPALNCVEINKKAYTLINNNI